MTVEEKSNLIRAHCDSISCYKCPLDDLNGKHTCYSFWREYPEEIERNYDLIFGNETEIEESKCKNDMVNHPSHYTSGGIECIEAIRASMTADGFYDYCKGNIIKYIWRWRDKCGVEDLRKASVYLNWLINAADEKEKK